MRMVHVLGSLDVGGAELRLLDLCRELREEDAEQVFVLLAGRRGAIADRFEALGATVQRCDLHPIPTFPRRLYATFCRLRPDAVVAHVALVSGLVLTVARAARVRTRIAWFRSDGDGREETAARRAVRAVLRLLLRTSATSVVAVSPAALRFGIARPERWRRGIAEVIPNGVDTARFAPVERAAARQALGIAADALVLLHLGRAAPEKNRAFLIEVLAEMRAGGAAPILLLAGPGGTDDVTIPHPGAATDAGVVFLGARDDVPTLLGAADALLLPSVREGMPGALLEALACGVPVVSNDLPGPREIARVLPGVELVDLALGPGVWASAVKRAIADHPPPEALHQAVAGSPYALASAARVWRAMW